MNYFCDLNYKYGFKKKTIISCGQPSHRVSIPILQEQRRNIGFEIYHGHGLKMVINSEGRLLTLKEGDVWYGHDDGRSVTEIP